MKIVKFSLNKKILPLIYLLLFLSFLTLILFVFNYFQNKQPSLLGFNNIRKIIIENKSNNSLINLEKNEKGEWIVNNNYLTDKFIVDEVVDLIKNSVITDIVAQSKNLHSVFDINDKSTKVSVFGDSTNIEFFVGKTSSTNGTYINKVNEEIVYHISKNLNYFTSYSTFDFVSKQINSIDRSKVEYVQIQDKIIYVNIKNDNNSQFQSASLEQSENEIVNLLLSFRSIRAVDRSVVLGNDEEVLNKYLITIKIIDKDDLIVQELIQKTDIDFFYSANNLLYQISSSDFDKFKNFIN